MRASVLGGGSGNFVLASGLMRFDVDLNVIVSIADSGGSSGVLRIEQGTLPPGDILRAMVAMCEGGEFLRLLLQHRFKGGSLDNHTLGNLILTASEKLTGSALSGVRALHDVLKIRGRVIPVAAVAANLQAECADGKLLQGESEIDVPKGPHEPIVRCYLEPAVDANPEALEAIRSADVVVLSPGDLYTSLVPVVLVRGVVGALRDTSAPIVFVVNLITKRGETDGYTAREFCRQVERYISPAKLHTVILNTARPSDLLLRKYEQAGVQLVHDDLNGEGFEVIRAPLLSESIDKMPDDGAQLHKLIRHDPVRLAQAIMSVARQTTREGRKN